MRDRSRRGNTRRLHEAIQLGFLASIVELNTTLFDIRELEVSRKKQKMSAISSAAADMG